MSNPEEPLLVIGAGTMGHGIAQVCALAGFDVTLFDVSADALARAIVKVGASLDEGVERGKVSPGDRDQAKARLQTTTDLGSAAASATIVIEAVPERMELKRKIFADAGEASVGDVKDALGLTRKHVIPLLEYFDAQRITVRVGNARRKGPEFP